MKNKELALDKRKQIALVIKSEREQKGVLIEELAEMVGVSKSTLQRIEEAKFSPDSNLLCVILDKLGLEIKIVENDK